MKYYKNPADNSLWAYASDGSEDAFIRPELIAISTAEYDAIRAAQAAITVVPYTVTPFQAKAALLQAGLLDAVKVAVLAAPPIVQLAWSDATEFTRDSPTIAALAAQLGLTDAQVDDLFIAASQVFA